MGHNANFTNTPVAIIGFASYVQKVKTNAERHVIRNVSTTQGDKTTVFVEQGAK